MAAGRKVRCLHCGDVIQSMHRHDFVRCKCGKIFIDGGGEYTRLGWDEGKIEDNLEIMEDDDGRSQKEK